MLLHHEKTPGFLASEGEEFNPEPEMRLHRSELLCNKVLSKYKGDKVSDTDIRRGQKEYPLDSVSSGVIYSVQKDLHNEDNHDGVITHLEPNILECEGK